MPELKSASRRWMYRGGRPNPVAGILGRATATLASAGLSPRRLVTLEVRGRRSDRIISFPVVVADYQGERYLVAMLGRGANWVRNVEAAGGAAVIRHGRPEAVNLEPVDPETRAPILRRYLELAPGARAHIPIDQRAPLSEFAGIAAEYPVFRITEPQSAEGRDAGVSRDLSHSAARAMSRGETKAGLDRSAGKDLRFAKPKDSDVERR